MNPWTMMVRGRGDIETSLCDDDDDFGGSGDGDAGVEEFMG